MPTEKYSLLMRSLHWIMAFLIIFALLSGLFTEDLPKFVRKDIMLLHKSFGITIIGLLILRIISRLTSRIPQIHFTKPERILAGVTYVGLYVLMLIIPLSGYLMSLSYGRTVLWFGIQLPTLLSENRTFGKLFYETHEIAANILIILLGLHILGFLKHLVIDKVNLVRRIL